MDLYSPSAAASNAAGSSTVVIAGLDLTPAQPGMLLYLGSSDRRMGDGYEITQISRTGTNSGTVQVKGSNAIAAAHDNVGFRIDPAGFLGSETALAISYQIQILMVLRVLLGPQTNLYTASRVIALDKGSDGALSRVLFAIQGVPNFAVEQRTVNGVEALCIRYASDGQNFADAITIRLDNGSVAFGAGVETGFTSTIVPSAAVCDIGSAPSQGVEISGATTITGFGSAGKKQRWIRFTGALTLTHNAGSLILPGGANITTAPDDTAFATSDGAGNWRVWHYQRATAQPLAAAATVLPSAATIDVGGAASLVVDISGTAPITSFGTKPNRVRHLRFLGALTLTHNAASLVLPGAANITTAAGDTALAISDAGGNWTVRQYQRADGSPLFNDLASPEATLASAATVDLGSVRAPRVAITGTTAITSFGTGANLLRFLRFAGALTLTHNAATLALPGAANILTSAGDWAVASSDAAGNWTVRSYHRADGSPLFVDLASAESTLASAATVDLGSVRTPRVAITGTTAITSFGTGANLLRFLRFAGALTLTHNAATMALPGAANIVTAAGDTAVASSDATGNWIVRSYQRADGSPLVAAAPMVPAGRLSLVPAVSVPTSDVAGAVAVNYTFGGGAGILPISDGTRFVPSAVAGDLSLALDATATDTGFHQSGKIFDVFAFNDAGTIRIGTGPAWTSDTARGTGAGTSEITANNGLWVNAQAITLRYGSATASTRAVAAGRATYLGSFVATADGQASDTAAKRLLFNAYNPLPRAMFVNDPAASWTYSTAAFRQVNGNAANAFDYLHGLAGLPVRCQTQSAVSNSTATTRVAISGIGVDSTTVNSAQVTGYLSMVNSAAASSSAAYSGSPGLGRHKLNWLEYGAGADVQTWYGINAGAYAFRTGMVGEVVL